MIPTCRHPQFHHLPVGAIGFLWVHGHHAGHNPAPLGALFQNHRGVASFPGRLLLLVFEALLVDGPLELRGRQHVGEGHVALDDPSSGEELGKDLGVGRNVVKY